MQTKGPEYAKPRSHADSLILCRIEYQKTNFDAVINPTNRIQEGAKFIATNPDLTGPSQRGPVLACGAKVAPIEKVT